jgi:putative hydrolase of the HAD superfamily
MIPRGTRVISFDVGGTLIEPWPSVGGIYSEEAFRVTGIRLDPEILRQRFHWCWGTFGQERLRFDYSISAWQRVVQEVFFEQIPHDRVPEVFDRLWRRFLTAEAWRVFPDVQQTLSTLAARNYRLIAVSNWDERLRPTLGALGLLEYFEEVFVSFEVGFHKPDPRIFRHAASRLAVSPSECVHVGDSRREDFEGAHNAGWQGLLVQRDSMGEAGTIGSLEELIPGI